VPFLGHHVVSNVGCGEVTGSHYEYHAAAPVMTYDIKASQRQRKRSGGDWKQRWGMCHCTAVRRNTYHGRLDSPIARRSLHTWRGRSSFSDSPAAKTADDLRMRSLHTVSIPASLRLSGVQFNACCGTPTW